ncbi:unnamed protein product [Nesidiocoris tenuis]|uniref:Uncharacterized protein n=1 Tax=Nesidiocoris tenuis TaxID=355587 RepID=A0A6H5G6N5_9HEMI|nr:unnamed protein product [Nesidiocoris tenuis]
MARISPPPRLRGSRRRTWQLRSRRRPRHWNPTSGRIRRSPWRLVEDVEQVPLRCELTSTYLYIYITGHISWGCYYCQHAAPAKPLEGSYYTYGIDHDKYGAWYGTSYPHGYGGLGSGHGHGLYSNHDSLNHGAYGYGTYGSGYGHSDYGHAISSQNFNLKSYGGHIVHEGYGIKHDDPSSYANVYLKSGHHGGLYDGGHHGHGHGYATSYQNFNMKSYGGHYHKQHDHVSDYHHYVPEHGHGILEHHHEEVTPIHYSYHPAIETVHDVNHGLSLGYETGDYGHGISEYGHGLGHEIVTSVDHGHTLGHEPVSGHYSDYAHTLGDYGSYDSPQITYSSNIYGYEPHGQYDHDRNAHYGHSDHDISFHGYAFQ